MLYILYFLKKMINVSYSKDQKNNFSYILVSRCFQGAACVPMPSSSSFSLKGSPSRTPSPRPSDSPDSSMVGHSPGPFPISFPSPPKKLSPQTPCHPPSPNICRTIPFTLYLNTITTKHPTPLPSGLAEQRPLQLLFSQEEKPGDADERRLKGDDGHRKGAGP